MNRGSIGGTLDYRALAVLHRPQDPEQLGREARRLAASGLTPNDIGSALGIGPAAVRELVGVSDALTREVASG